MGYILRVFFLSSLYEYTCLLSIESQLCHEPTFILLNFRAIFAGFRAFVRISSEVLRVKICAAPYFDWSQTLNLTTSSQRNCVFFLKKNFSNKKLKHINVIRFHFRKQQQQYQTSLVKWNSFVLRFRLFGSVWPFYFWLSFSILIGLNRMRRAKENDGLQ